VRNSVKDKFRVIEVYYKRDKLLLSSLSYKDYYLILRLTTLAKIGKEKAK
jgi:hypothetical protein